MMHPTFGRQFVGLSFTRQQTGIVGRCQANCVKRRYRLDEQYADCKRVGGVG